MAITNLQALKSAHATAVSGVAQTIAFASNVAANSSLFLDVTIASATANIMSVTDTFSNLYVINKILRGNGVTLYTLYVPLNLSAGPNTVSVIINASVDVELTISEFSFGAGNQAAISQQAGAISGANSTTITSNAFTTTVAVVLAKGSVWCQNTCTASTWAGATSLITSGGHLTAYLITSSTQSVAVTGTQNTTGSYVGVTSTFYAAPIATSYYIVNSAGGLGTNDGSSAANAKDASTAALLAAIVAAQNVYGTKIIYAAGTYLTTGSLAMYSGITHQGSQVAGSPTILQLAAGTAYVRVFTTSSVNFSDSISAFVANDLTIDFNASNQGWWVANGSGNGASVGFYTGVSDHCLFQRCTFINMGAQTQESFPITLAGNASGIGNINNNTITGCIFKQPIPVGSSNSGITCIDIVDGSAGNTSMTCDATNIVTNCQFLDLSNYHGKSDFSYSHGTSAPVTQNCYARDVDVLVYFEPGDVSGFSNYLNITVQVTGNVAVDCSNLVLWNCTASGGGGPINIANNTFIQRKTVGYVAVWGQSSFVGTNAFGAITITGNTFIDPVGALAFQSLRPFNFPVSGTHIMTVTTLTFTNNVMIGLGPGVSDTNQTAIRYNPAWVTTYVSSGNLYMDGPQYPAGLDVLVGTGVSGALLSAGGVAGESHKICHDEISAAIIALEQNATANDTFLIQEHFDTSTVAATLVTTVPQGAFDVIPTFAGTGCTIVRAASVAGHKGIWTLTTGTVASQKPEVSQLPTLKDIQTGFFGKLAFRAVVQTPATLPSGNTTANAVWRIGFTDTLGSLAPVNCIEWVFNPNTNAFWSLVLTNASTVTTTASLITVAINAWYDLQIYVDSTGVQARAGIYNALLLPAPLASGPFTTNQPATSTNMAWHVLAMNGASGTTSFALGLDLIEVAGQPTNVGLSSNWRGANLLKGF